MNVKTLQLSLDEINRIKESASTFGTIIKLHDGTRLYCESGEQTMKVLKSRRFSDAAWVEYGPERSKY